MESSARTCVGEDARRADEGREAKAQRSCHLHRRAFARRPSSGATRHLLPRKRAGEGAYSRQACAACARLAAWADEGPSEARIVPLAPPSRCARFGVKRLIRL